MRAWSVSRVRTAKILFWGKANQYTSPGNQYTSPGNQYTSPGNQHTSPGNQYTSHGNQYTSHSNLRLQTCSERGSKESSRRSFVNAETHRLDQRVLLGRTHVPDLGEERGLV
ncbi:hypothetical protein STEG23_013290 [Scotinomys teguina]